MLQTYGAVVKRCSLSYEGGMMIEYMSAVILTGCGPEVCVTSNTTKQRLRRQAEQNRGHWKRERGGGGVTVTGNKARRTDWTVRDRQREVYGESYPLKLLNYPSNSARWSGLRNHRGNNTTTIWVGYPCPDPFSPLFLHLNTHTELLLHSGFHILPQFPNECTHSAWANQHKYHLDCFNLQFFLP